MATQQRMKAYFDGFADRWDAMCVHDPEKLAAIATLAGIRRGARVLDAACGTGALIPVLLAKEPAGILGVDLSDKMIAGARRKFSDPRLRLLAADLFQVKETGFEVMTVYSAYPHFMEKERFARHASRLLAPGGRIVIAHSEGRATINGRHEGSAAPLSVPLCPVGEEAAWFAPFFHMDILIDTPEMYMLSGTRADAHASAQQA